MHLVCKTGPAHDGTLEYSRGWWKPRINRNPFPTYSGERRLCEQYGNKDDMRKIITFFVGFEVLTEVVMKSSIFWGITQSGPLEVRAVVAVGVTSVFSLVYVSTLKM
jgi:hypothetical protein